MHISHNNKSAMQKLHARMKDIHSCLCVGLDPSLSLFSPKIKKSRYPLFTFNKIVIKATAEYAAAFKPNVAFYEAYGAGGILQLKKTCDFLRFHYPTIPILLDAKRADIDTTNNGTVQFAYDYLQVDGITLNPYLGREALQPFLDRKEKISIILCHTSNQGSGEFQELSIGNEKQREPLYLKVARQVFEEWNSNGNCMLVVGATFPKELAKVRGIVGEMTLLVPGVGTQGGNMNEVIKYGQNKKKNGILINVGRGILSLQKDIEMREAAKKYSMKP